MRLVQSRNATVHQSPKHLAARAAPNWTTHTGTPSRLLDHAERLDRRADMELAHGRAAQAERLAHLAAALREGGRTHEHR